MKRITVLLAEDHMVVREGLRKLLAAEADLFTEISRGADKYLWFVEAHAQAPN